MMLTSASTTLKPRALPVTAIPEGLPAVIPTCLTLGSKFLSKSLENNLRPTESISKLTLGLIELKACENQVWAPRM
ncbi:unnamed protein product [Phytophthora fragariaefolia]|uniref:Unnamed protein product n=1 Tax=Phytophthora fragariaefolia TaxID=1490495 RepID=A0A9W6TPM2_9STRA|nr:unnamed protein product [Phytophthora fragariaefolia]